MSDQTLPVDVRLHRKSALLELVYADETRYELSAEYLRVHSPSAEVRGHGKGREVLQTGKRGVGIKALEGVGNYAIRLVFDDGHDSGIYSWAYLADLGRNHEAYWQRYLERLREAGASRESLPPGTQVVSIVPLNPKSPGGDEN